MVESLEPEHRLHSLCYAAKGLARTGPFVIASVGLYQVLFLDNHRHHRPVAHIKEIIDEGRWRIAA
jgi:hypothetical protein